MSDKEKKDVCGQKITYGDVENCSVAEMKINDCTKCPLSTINTTHPAYSVWHDNMIEIGYLKR